MITYETNHTHPGTLPSATIHMGGLLCLSFDHANRCTVAVNNMVGNGHKWKFSIVDQDSGKRIVDLKQGNAQELHEVHINVTGSTTTGTYVYNGDPVSIPANNERRFNLERSWIDLEGRRGHEKLVENDAHTLWPRFYINQGLFCASKLSTASFALKDGNAKPLIRPLGNIALAVVADIFLNGNPDSKIEVKLPDQTISLDQKRKYQIYITNDCGIDYASYAPVASDFHLHYEAFRHAFDGSHGKMKPEDRFHLVCNTASSSSSKVKAESAMVQSGGGPNYLTDKAPCMLTVLSQTSALKA